MKGPGFNCGATDEKNDDVSNVVCMGFRESTGSGVRISHTIPFNNPSWQRPKDDGDYQAEVTASSGKHWLRTIAWDVSKGPRWRQRGDCFSITVSHEPSCTAQITRRFQYQEVNRDKRRVHNRVQGLEGFSQVVAAIVMSDPEQYKGLIIKYLWCHQVDEVMIVIEIQSYGDYF